MSSQSLSVSLRMLAVLGFAAACWVSGALVAAKRSAGDDAGSEAVADGPADGPRESRQLVSNAPDHITDELCKVLAEDKALSFDDLFQRVFENLKARNAVSGGEEMVRLRAYEKLQNLVTRGLVEKTGKEYKGTRYVGETIGGRLVR